MTVWVMAALDFVQINNDMHMNEACTSQSPCVFIILATYIEYRTGGGQTVKMTLRWLYILVATQCSHTCSGRCIIV